MNHSNNINTFVCNNTMSELLKIESPKALELDLYDTIRQSARQDINNMKNYGTVIVQKRNIDPKTIFSDIKSIYGTLSNYEWNCNETYIPIDKTCTSIAFAALLLLNCLKEKLKQKFPNNNFCVVISIDIAVPQGVTAHYYQVRDEKPCFDLIIDNYIQPVVYEYI